MLQRSLLVAAAICGLSISQPRAEDYPTRPITLVVPYSAGGASDTLARMLADSLGNQLGQRVIIVNVDGAGGTLGAERVVKAAPDGYTLLINHLGMAIAPAIYKNLPFDPIKDLEPVGLAVEAPMVLLGRKNLPANNLSDLVTYLKKEKERVTFAHGGTGSATQLCGLLFMRETQTTPTMVPYKGSAPALADLLGEHVDLVCVLSTDATAPVKGGKFKAFALTAPQRLASIPDIPTVDEVGIPKVHITTWYGLYAPPKTPRAIIDKLSMALAKSLRDKHLAQEMLKLESVLMSPDQATPSALTEKLSSETKFWKPILEKADAAAN